MCKSQNSQQEKDIFSNAIGDNLVGFLEFFRSEYPQGTELLDFKKYNWRDFFFEYARMTKAAHRNARHLERIFENLAT